MNNHEELNEVAIENIQHSHKVIVGLIIITVVLFGIGGYYFWQKNSDSVSEYEAKVAQLELTLNKEREKYNELLKKYNTNRPSRLKHVDCEGEQSVFGGCVSVGTLDFSYNGLPGTVEYVCETNSYFDDVCVGNGYLQVTYDGKSEIIERYTWADREEMLFTLHKVFFTEDMGRSTTSNSKYARLLISLDTSRCRNLEVCIGSSVITHEVRFPDYKVNLISKISASGHFNWNEPGNKAIQWIPCPAGCSPLMYQGIDIDTGAVTPLLWRSDDVYTSEVESPIEEDISYGRDDIEWLDGNTVRIGDYEFSI